MPDAPSADHAHLLFADLVAVPAVEAYVKEVVGAAKRAELEGRDVAALLGDMNVCILGPAGVGKSETARRIAKLFFKIGALPRDSFVEVVASNLSGTYQFITPPNIHPCSLTLALTSRCQSRFRAP